MGRLMPVPDASLVGAVAQLVREVARRDIMSRFRALAAADVAEKAPGDLVTIADRAAEGALAEQLTAMLPGSAVIGEEAVASDPSLLNALDSSEPVWIVDPIDGTHNFVNGSPSFAVLVALAHCGELLASWTHAPALGLTATATKGGGAYVDGRRVRVCPAPDGLRGLDVVTSRERWWSDVQPGGYDALAAHGASMCHIEAAGLEYVRMARGRRCALVWVWDFPWDHAAGLLLHAEAGGSTRTADGAPFRLAGGNSLPFVCAPDPATARAITRVIALAKVRG
jgi:fructose-1,6-bisphosphatase/inositol monophosphatase family enzyme